MRENLDGFQRVRLFEQRPLNFSARNVFKMENPEIGVPAFFSEIVVFAAVFFIEAGAVIDQFLNTTGRFTNHDFNNVTIA